jgi:hypothetical protein
MLLLIRLHQSDVFGSAYDYPLSLDECAARGGVPEWSGTLGCAIANHAERPPARC